MVPAIYSQSLVAGINLMHVDDVPCIDGKIGRLLRYILQLKDQIIAIGVSGKD